MDWKLPKVDSYFASILARTPEGFELDHLEYALRHCTRFRLAVDGGAHIGTWTVAMASRFERVYAFEPAADSYSCLIENTQHVSNLAAMLAALGAVQGRCTVFDDPARPGNTGARMVRLADQGSVWMYTIDSFEFDDLDFLKLDLEGYEIEALKGARQTLVRCGPVVVIECKQFVPPRRGGPNVAVKFLTELGYRQVGGVRNDRVFVRGAGKW